jgi:group I intron endonuclease
MAIVYKITNTVNGKSYIGATEKTLEERWSGHVKAAMVKNLNFMLSKAIRKYGPEAFIREVLEEHPDRKYTFDVLEPKYILEHNTFGDNGYNMTGGSEGGIGHKHTEETKQKIRESLVANFKSKPPKPPKIKEIKPRKPLSEKQRESLRLSHLGRKLSEETKKKISNSLKGKKLSEETKEKISSTRLAKKFAFTPEHKEKLRQSGLKRTYSKEIGIKISNSLKGKKLSEEHKEKLRQSALNKKHTPETKEKLRLIALKNPIRKRTKSKV